MIKSIALFVSTVTTSYTLLANTDVTGSAGGELRYFLQDPLYETQERAYGSAFLSPETYTEWNDGEDSLLFKPFFRVDQYDEERTHFDVRELQWLHVSDTWETKVGVGKVFWGQTESIHLVDIINQTDTVESVDGEDKLGQPMVNFSYFSDFGTFSAFVLPYFRERTFASADGRLRPPLAVGDALYESDSEQSHVDYALRWQSTISDWEVGLSYFSGTSREPELVTNINEEGVPEILPYYAQISQVGVDLLTVYGSWLLKFESIYREGQSEDFAAVVTGFEYTTEGIFGTQYGLGILSEYQFDERDDNFFALGQNDLMVGLRFTVNDVDGTEVLMGYVQDLDVSSTSSAFIEASSRISPNWRWQLDGYFFSSDDVDDTFYYMRRDDHLKFTLEYFF
ncbi:hypothetical protein Q4561_04745 [Alteromonas sp. 1_MG-2023]|uniref:hypothetical protein n=1 Tax=Alteromonas sp. 1_MG-2023 TaxID=3062669 RepID=UPI0026E3D6DA|nr:hypothetical protein [Alteromonas sp. 1_MG-2023]MDO6566355.1 hypothetical protein [Alteromonas sp. 1_MG-2023]